MKNCMTRLLVLALCLMLCVCACPGAAYAFEMVDLTHPVSLTIFANDEETPLPGVGFELYLVAEMNEYAQFELLPRYESFSGDINKLDTAADWIFCAEEMLRLTADADPDDAATSRENGEAVMDNLKPGLYLLSGKPVEILPWAYTFTPFMVSVPNRDFNDAWVYDVYVDVKLEKEPAVKSIEVAKVWDDIGYEDKRPGSIYVDLYCDGEQIAAAQLHDGNSWSCTFENLAAAHEYTVRERDVPQWYKASYEMMNGVLVIRNERDTTVTPVPDIPSTGQLWWPVPVLAGGGVLLVIIGWFINRKWSQEHEK